MYTLKYLNVRLDLSSCFCSNHVMFFLFFFGKINSVLIKRKYGNPDWDCPKQRCHTIENIKKNENKEVMCGLSTELFVNILYHMISNLFAASHLIMCT